MSDEALKSHKTRTPKYCACGFKYNLEMGLSSHEGKLQPKTPSRSDYGSIVSSSESVKTIPSIVKPVALRAFYQPSPVQIYKNNKNGELQF